MDTTQFWESRAQRFAGRGAGLQAVCSYAMPDFYNFAIDVTQRAALSELIDSVGPGSKVLDYGCGIGRWSREFARRGACVTAVDFSPTMIEEARRRTERVGLAGSCRFIRSDVCDIELDQSFDVVFGVTVLQHVVDDDRLRSTVGRLARHLLPGGRLIMVEAAPTRPRRSCDTRTFRARPAAAYCDAIEASGLCIAAVQGVDPAPFKLWVIPRFQRWPRGLGLAALWFATLVSLPFDLLLARFAARWSWHKVIVAKAPGGET